MRILYVCKSLPKSFQGGIQTHVWHLSAHMANLGHDVSILTAGGLRKKTQRYTLEGRNIIELPYLPLRRQPILSILAEEWSFNISVNLWLKKHVNEYDIIHLQGRSGFIFPQKKNVIPVVTTLHGLVNLENEKSFSAKNIDKQIHEQWASHYEKNSLLNSDGLIAVSNEMQQEIEAVMPSIIKKITIIPNGVEKALNVSENKTDNDLLVFVGRLERIKGVFNLLNAMKTIDKRVKLVMIGDGSERVAMEKFIHTEGLADRVTLTGALQSADVMEWISKSYALILPSFHETQGIVLLEANTLSKPVLASDIGGIKEVVENNRNGLLFNPHVYQEISEKVNFLFRNPQLAFQMGKEGKKIVETKFLWENIARRTEILYSELINTRLATSSSPYNQFKETTLSTSYSHAQK